MAVSSAVDFRECPDCGGYGVRDNGDNCVTCGGVGRGGLSSPPGSCIGSGELIIDKATRLPLSHAEFMARVAREHGNG